MSYREAKTIFGWSHRQEDQSACRRTN